MPIDVPTELLSASSGSVGDVVASHNQHGPYLRARTVPTDPATGLQTALRTHLSTLCTAWNTTLTQTQRDTWNRYALQVRLTGPTGRRNHVGGIAMYVRSNLPRLQAADPLLPRLDTAPDLYDLGSASPLQRAVLNVVNDTLHVFFNEADPWRTDTGSALLFYASAAQPLTRNFWSGPYRYAGPILGKPVPAPQSPFTIALPFTYAPGQRCFVRYRLTSSDGRLTVSRRLPADHLPQIAPLPTSVASQFAFPTLTVDVYFDHLLSGFTLSTAPWSIRYIGYTWNISSVRVYGSYVRLLSTRGPLNPGLNLITYAPPPADVIALLTGIPAAGFARSIPWN